MPSHLQQVLQSHSWPVGQMKNFATHQHRVIELLQNHQAAAAPPFGSGPYTKGTMIRPFLEFEVTFPVRAHSETLPKVQQQILHDLRNRFSAEHPGWDNAPDGVGLKFLKGTHTIEVKIVSTSDQDQLKDIQQHLEGMHQADKRSIDLARLLRIWDWQQELRQPAIFWEALAILKTSQTKTLRERLIQALKGCLATAKPAPVRTSAKQLLSLLLESPHGQTSYFSLLTLQ